MASVSVDVTDDGERLIVAGNFDGATSPEVSTARLASISRRRIRPVKSG